MNTALQVIAQSAGEASLFAQYGLLGAVLGWFMYHGSKLPSEIRALAHRVEGLTRALLVDMSERESSGIHVKRHCRDEIARIDARNKK